MDKYVKIDTIQNSEVVLERLKQTFHCECIVVKENPDETIVAIKGMSPAALSYLQENQKSTPSVDCSILMSNTSVLNKSLLSYTTRTVTLHIGLLPLFKRPMFISFFNNNCLANIEYNNYSLSNILQISGEPTAILQGSHYIEIMTEALIDARENQWHGQETLQKLYSLKNERDLSIPTALIQDIVHCCAPECLVVLLKLLNEIKNSTKDGEPHSEISVVNCCFQERALVPINPLINNDSERENLMDRKIHDVAPTPNGQLHQIISFSNEKSIIQPSKQQKSVIESKELITVQKLSEQTPQPCAQLKQPVKFPVKSKECISTTPATPDKTQPNKQAKKSVKFPLESTKRIGTYPLPQAESTYLMINEKTIENSPRKNEYSPSTHVSAASTQVNSKGRRSRKSPNFPRAPSVDSNRMMSKEKTVMMPLNSNKQGITKITAPKGVFRSSHSSPERDQPSTGQWFADVAVLSKNKGTIITKSSSHNRQEIVSTNQITNNLRTVTSAPALTIANCANLRRRPVIIDGQNVAHMMFANQFSPEAIVCAVKYFQDRGHDHITVIVPVWTSKFEALQRLYKDNLLRYVPKRVVNNESQECHDDLCVIQTAMAVDGVILSNDQYRNETAANPAYKQFVDERLLMFYFSGKILIIPEEVHGPNKPKLSEILCFPPEQQNHIKKESNCKVANISPTNADVKIPVLDKIPHASTNNESELVYPRRPPLMKFVMSKQVGEGKA